MRVIIKTEVRKMIFGHAVIAWIFFLIFHYCKILNFGLLKVCFRPKKTKRCERRRYIKSYDLPGLLLSLDLSAPVVVAVDSDQPILVCSRL